MSDLKLGPGLTLPPEAALQRFCILAMSGAGKSNTAVVLAEEMYDASIPWVAVDPKGDWWGVRSSKTGKRGGLEVPVFGGLQGDIPLQPTAGKMIAELIASERLTCVLDVSEFNTKADQLRFLTDFANTLLRKNRDPLMVFAEEADEYLPEGVKSAEAQCVGAWSRVVKRGRFRGIFVTLITQRSAALNKNALNQVDTLIPMRTTAPHDRKAIKAWVEQHNIGAELLDSLPELDDGEAWIWSPQKLKFTKRVTFRRRRTYDSGATPDLTSKRMTAKRADVDLSAIQEQMQETIEQVKANDPAELRKKISELESRLGRTEDTLARAEVELERRPTEPVEVEVPVFPEELKEEIISALEKVGDDIGHGMETIGNVIEHAKADFDHDVREPKLRQYAPMIAQHDASPGKPLNVAMAEVTGEAQSGNGEIKLDKPKIKILSVLLQYPQGRSMSQLGLLSGYSPKSGHFKNSISKLRTMGLVTPAGSGPIQATSAASAVITEIGQEPTPLPTGEALFYYWANKLDKPKREILVALYTVWPESLSVEQIAERTETGYSPTSGHFKNSMSKLRTLELIEGYGQIKLSDTLGGD